MGRNSVVDGMHIFSKALPDDCQDRCHTRQFVCENHREDNITDTREHIRVDNIF